MTYYEWLCAAGARGRTGYWLYTSWIDGVDPSEVRKKFEEELRALRAKLTIIETGRT